MLKGVCQTFHKLVAKDRAEHLDVQEEIPWRRDPAGVIGRESTSRYDIVNMGMPLQGLSPGMQDAKKSDLGAKTTFWIGSHLQQSRGAGIEQESEQDFPVLPDQRHQHVGNTKDNMKVDHR